MRSIILLNIFILIFSFNLRSQDYFEDDFGLWLGIKLDKKLYKKVDLNLSCQSRFRDNFSTFSRLNSKAGLTWRLNKNLRLLGGYMWSERQNNEAVYSRRYRYYGGLVLRKRTGKWLFLYRNLLQYQGNDLQSGDATFYDRNRLQLDHDFSRRISWSLSEELNTDLSGREGFYYISRSRSVAELIFHYSKSVDLNLYFLFQRKYNYRSQPERDFVLGLNFSLNI